MNKVKVTSELLYNEQDGYLLKIKLRNAGNKQLSIYKGNLPWESTQRLLLIAVTTDPEYTPLKEHVYIDDPGPEIMTLSKDETVEGKILLKDRFPDIKQALKKNSVIVFWNYKLDIINNKNADRYGGWFLLDKL